MSILIKRYANRKLYNTETSRYITLKGVAALLDEGQEVRVIDNETGEDITQVALSQILVGSERAKQDPSDTLLTQILSRSGDALYGAIRKSVDDASDGIGDFGERFKHFVNQAEAMAPASRGFSWDRRADSSPGSGLGGEDADGDESRGDDRSSHGRDQAAQDDLETLVRDAVSDAIAELPSHEEIRELNRNLVRVAKALEKANS
ncbi:MAG: polyhydroxyalkanoate synthesis regulator DNA-binding domain-containing protein [Myxococcota bacterium]